MSYKYSLTEVRIAQTLSIISHIPLSFLLFLMIKKNYNFECIFGMCLILSSVLYHFFDMNEEVFIMEPTNWHRLDNIASLSSLNNIVIEFLSASRTTRLNIRYVSLCSVLFFQTIEPYDFICTVSPLFICILIILCFNISNGWPKVNKSILFKGLLFLSTGLFFFYKGLDDANDYLRLNHTVWHFFVSLGAYFLWQAQDDELIGLREGLAYGRQMFSHLY